MNEYFSISSLREFWHNICYAPNGKQGFYCKANQKKQRKMRRRMNKGARR